MNLIDVVLLGVIILAVRSGVKNGFVLEAVNLACWVTSIMLTFLLFPHIVSLLEETLRAKGFWVVPFSFIIVLTGLSLSINAVADRGLRFIPEDVHVNRLNKGAGFLPGLMGGIIKACIVTALFLLVPFSEWLAENTRESRIAAKLTAGFTKLESVIAPGFEMIQRSMNKTVVEPDPGKLIRLGFKVEKTEQRVDLEEEMLHLINEERRKAGRSPLQADPEMRKVALGHSADMFSRGYFSHVSPEGSSPFDRIRKAHVSFTTAGENIALAQTLKLAHEGLMNSPGHRANILSGAYGRVGIAILDGGIYGLMITQNFRN
ncbi:CvpA family protein [Pararcticibacter amylolyticus]|uniref:SCP domain-containing protein n=1 Tax=Pararcticibacter amylolyticus TaxID=2173175 RepID=A0A2U2P9P4_9SPHI|nr:CvpA family protein [Pararcticibacter amylolyticus]PWG78112.1 hypothetical protein DDR33_23885 [Pararcticibacter amylolyticus]